MKTRLTILILSGFTLMVFAGIVAHPRPLARVDFALPIAYTNAVGAMRLADRTDYQKDGQYYYHLNDNPFYCVSAKLSTNFVPSGCWTFEFSYTNDLHRIVMVWQQGDRFITAVTPPQP